MHYRPSSIIMTLTRLFFLLAAAWLVCPVGGAAQVVAAPAQGSPGGAGRRLLRIDQSRQMMYVYEEGVRVRIIPVSTGRPTTNTMTNSWRGTVGRDMGAISVLGGMYADYAWFLYPDLFGNILIHSVPYVRQSGTKVYDQAGALGIRPSSHGCIRISPRDAAWLRAWDPTGAQIQISAWSGPIRVVTP